MEEPIKAIIWCVPRSCSTALLKSLSSLPDAKIFNELYSVAFVFGPEGPIMNKQSPSEEKQPAQEEDQPTDESQSDDGYVFPSSICTFQWVKQMLEGDYPGRRVIFSKEMAYCLYGKYECLPQGYRHVFLLRHPSKTFPSFKKQAYDTIRRFYQTEYQIPPTMEELQFDKLNPEQSPIWLAFKEVHDLYQHVKERKLEEDPLVIDTDDLMSHPAAVMSALCAKLGLQYSNALLTWDKGLGTVETWTQGKEIKRLIEHTSGFENFRNSTGFHRQEADKQATASPGEVKVTPDIQLCIDKSLPFYLKMYKKRIKVDGNS